MRTSRLTAACCGAVLVATMSMGAVPTAEAGVATCQGKPATIVGPNDGSDTVGTPGDDVIVAPVGHDGTVSALAGNDTICVVDGASVPPRGDIFRISAGEGSDEVDNQQGSEVDVDLGPGADTYVGNDNPGAIATVTASTPGAPDDAVDVIQGGRGLDRITSGSTTPGVENHDLISTGDGWDLVRYYNAGGEAIDNGAGAPDFLWLSPAWQGPLTIDNVAERASVSDQTVLTWTSVVYFNTQVRPGSSVSFVGSDAPENLNITGTVPDLSSSTATIAMGGGGDRIQLASYLPLSVDAGAGSDVLVYRACERAYVALNVAALCLPASGPEVDTDLAGIEIFYGTAAQIMNIRGTEGADRISVHASRSVLVRSLGGPDWVRASARKMELYGGRGADELMVRGLGGSSVKGGAGGDVLRGSKGRDQLYGGLGHDRAYGMAGTRDLCRAEVEVDCEL